MNEFNNENDCLESAINFNNEKKVNIFVKSNLIPAEDLYAKQCFGVDSAKKITTRYMHDSRGHNKEKEIRRSYEGFIYKNLN